MLYERWRQIARDRRRHLALRDLASGEQWTFGELETLTEGAEPEPAGLVCPSGQGAEFVIRVLQAWRAGCVVFPPEPGQDPPPMIGLPPGVAHVKTTSATTGTARYVLFTAAQLMADASNIVETMGLREDWPNLGVISLAHSYGFSNLVLPLLLHGIPLILVGSALPEAVRRAAADVSDLTIAAVPALWRTWHDAGVIPTNTRLAISAAAPLPLLLERQILGGSGLKVHNFYGSTECGGIAYDAGEELRQEESCAGIAMKNVRVSADNSGCLVVESEAVAETYWPESSANLASGMFRTSDLAEVSNGWIYLRGRLSDQINVAGRKVSPEVIERALVKHPQVRQCTVFGVPLAEIERGEMIVACLVVAGRLTADALLQFLIERLPAWQIPRDWWFVESLEANRRGKVSRAEWRRHYLERRQQQGPKLRPVPRG